MSQDNLFTQTDGMRSFAQTHADVATGLSGLLRSGADASGVELTHGPIASPVHSALARTLQTRQGSLRGAANIGTKLAESLRQAAHGYDGVDQASADQLRAVADAVDGGLAGGGLAADAAEPVAAAGAGAGEGAGVLGQLLGQLGQVGGQLAQAGAGLFQGSVGGAQPVVQLAQPFLQGATQAVQQAGRGSHQKGGEQAAAPVEPITKAPDEARPGQSTATGPAPTEPVAFEPNTSAQTPHQ